MTQLTDSLSGTVTETYDNQLDAFATDAVRLGASTSTNTIADGFDAVVRLTQMRVTGQTALTYDYDDANRGYPWSPSGCHPLPQHCNGATPPLSEGPEQHPATRRQDMGAQVDPSDL